MANDFGALGSAIYTLVDTATTLPVYADRAPQGSAWPYVLIQRQDAQDEYTFSGQGIAADYAVQVISRDYWPGSAQRTYDALNGQINGAGGSVTGYNLLRFERQATIMYQEPTDTGGIWHVGGLYRVEAWEV